MHTHAYAYTYTETTYVACCAMKWVSTKLVRGDNVRMSYVIMTNYYYYHCTTHAHTHTRTHTHIHSHTLTHTHTHIHTHSHTRTHTFTHIHTHSHTRTHTHSHIHTHSHTLTHIHTHAHTTCRQALLNMQHLGVTILREQKRKSGPTLKRLERRAEDMYTIARWVPVVKDIVEVCMYVRTV